MAAQRCCTAQVAPESPATVSETIRVGNKSRTQTNALCGLDRYEQEMDTDAELREMSAEQLDAMVKEASQALFRLRVQAQTERLDVPSELKRNRRLIARIKTIQRQREIDAANAGA